MSPYNGSITKQYDSTTTFWQHLDLGRLPSVHTNNTIILLIVILHDNKT